MSISDFIVAYTAHFFAPFLSLIHSKISVLIKQGIICDHFVPKHRECIECLMEEEYKEYFERVVEGFFYLR